MKKLYRLDKGMTQAISHFSRYEDAAVEVTDGKYSYTGERRKSAEVKIRRFYRNTMLFLWVAALALLLLTNAAAWQAPSQNGADGEPTVPEGLGPS